MDMRETRGLRRTHRELHFNTVTCFLTGLFEREDERVEILVGNLMVFCVREFRGVVAVLG
jgi:hypothetical protein